MRFLIIIPAHNEAQNISFCLESLRRQSHHDFLIIVVDDGSTDSTPNLVQDFSYRDSRIKLLRLPQSRHEPGAKVVRTFNQGLEAGKGYGQDVICKFDADIIFPPDYLEQIGRIYLANEKAGMVSGLVRIKKSVFEHASAFDFNDAKHEWIFENVSSINHIRGPVKSYRTECFERMGGLRAVLGWDNIDVMLAEMHGFQVITLRDLWVKHLRPTAYKYKNQRAEKLGQYFYNIGLNWPLAAVSALKSSLKNQSFREFLVIMRSFAKQKDPLSLTQNEVHFIRQLRWKNMLKKLLK